MKRSAHKIAFQLGGIVWLMAVSVPTGRAQDVDISELPEPYPGIVDFTTDIKPILEAHCLRCHGPERPKSGFRIDNRESALNSGAFGPNIISGMSAESPLIHFVARLVPDMGMPPMEEGEPLRPYEIALLRAWIDQGVDFAGADTPPRTMLQLSMTSGVGYIGVEGDAARFRQNSRLNDGFSGGVTEFELRGPVDDQTDFGLDGRVIGGQDDARIRFDLDRDNWGAVRGGFETRRTWYDDSGGYFPTFDPPLYELGSDLYLDTGRAWVDFILEREGLPYVRLGYEYRFRDGTKSTTQWGPVSAPVKNIYPAYKDIDETTHIVKLDIAKEIAGWQLEDSLRVEWYDQRNTRVDATVFNSGKALPEKFTTVEDSYQHTQGANAFTVQKWFRDWFMVGGGYLYSWLDGDASFTQSNFLTDSAPVPPVVGFDFDDRFWNSSQILLDQNSHVGSLTTRMGPWQDLLFYAGVQSDWVRQRGFSDVTQRFSDPTSAGFPVLSYSSVDRQLFEQRAGLRFTGVPFSTFFIEGRWRQEQLDQSEDQEFSGFAAPHRGTDADADLQQYRFGLSTSPWQSVLLSAQFEVANQNNHYNPTSDDASNGPQGFGYPNFISARRVDGNEIETRLVARLASNLKSTFRYEYQRSDYQTTTRALFDGTPSGTVDAAERDAHVFSLGLNWTPWNRLGLNVTGSYADTDLRSFANGSPAVVPYAGDVWSVTSSVLWSLDEMTEINLLHTWSAADYQQSNFAAGLPLGIRYQWHQLRAGVGRRLSDSLRVNLTYLFQMYDEPSAGGFNDYTANGVFASLTWTWSE